MERYRRLFSGDSHHQRTLHTKPAGEASKQGHCRQAEHKSQHRKGLSWILEQDNHRRP